MKKSKTPDRDLPLKHYEQLIAAIPGLERKGASMPYTSRNGHMFSFLTPQGRLALRLPTREREAFLKQHGAKLCEQHGSVLREYVEVPDALLARVEELRELFAISHEFAGSLPPKATRGATATKRQPRAKVARRSKAKER